MSQTQNTPPTRPRRKPRLVESVKPLPPFALTITPEAIAVASTEHAEALARIDRARADAITATNAAHAAAEADRQAALEAVEAGKQMPKPTLPKMQEQAEAAARAVDAAEELARNTQFAFISTANDHREQLQATATDALDSADEQIGRALDQLEAALVRRRQLIEYQRAVRDLSEPMDRLASFSVHEPRPGRDPLDRSERQALDELRNRKQFGMAAFPSGRRS
jgi:hypothetical protein